MVDVCKRDSAIDDGFVCKRDIAMKSGLLLSMLSMMDVSARETRVRIFELYANAPALPLQHRRV